MKKQYSHPMGSCIQRILVVFTLLLLAVGSAYAAGNPPEDFITLYPGQLTEKEKVPFEKFMAEVEALNNRGPIDVAALIKGTLPKDTPGLGPVLEVTEEMVLYQNGKYDPENPVLNVAEYAKKLGYENIVAYPTFAPNDDAIMKAYPGDARDKLLVSDLNHNITYYKPIYPGDTIYTVINKRVVKDITPKEGAIYRSMVIQSEASLYNQKGEKVNDAVFRVTENVGILKEGKTAESDGGPMPAWISPAWTSRAAHTYTDADYQKIKAVWAAEKRQGATPLYWEDVKVGDYTVQTADGPILQSIMPTQPYGMGTGGSRTLKKEIMDPAIFKTMTKDASGIYITANKDDYIPPVPGAKAEKKDSAPQGGGAPPAGDAPKADLSNTGGIDTTQLHKTVENQRSVLFNFMGRDIAIRNIDNWMGDKGWLYNIRWSIMAPTALKAVGLTVPSSPLSERYVQRIPKLADAGRVMNAHGLTTDMAFVQAYVEKKYQEDGKNFVDLLWWVESIDGYIWEEGGATVILPSKSAK